ncbi:MAG: AAA family ATPase, partial [Capsulimonadaceae bacterium]
MMESFHIKNFKGLGDLELPMTAITLLGGRNNVGKSTVLEAVFTFYDRLNPRVFVSSYGWRGMGGLPIAPELLWLPTFSNYDPDKVIDLTAQLAGATHNLTMRFLQNYALNLRTTYPVSIGGTVVAQVDQASTTASALEIVYSVGGHESQRSHISIANGQLMYDVKTGDGNQTGSAGVAILNLRSHESEAEMANLYGQLDVLGKQNAVLEFLTILDPRIKS